MNIRYRHRCSMHAYSGHFEPLAKHLESGGVFLPCMREFIVAHLRGEIKFKRGARRTFAQKQLDREVGDEVLLIQEALNLNRSKAVAEYLHIHPSMNPDTLKSILNRYNRDRREARQRVEKMARK